MGKIKMFSHKQKLWEILPKEYAQGKKNPERKVDMQKEMASKRDFCNYCL